MKQGEGGSRCSELHIKRVKIKVKVNPRSGHENPQKE
jgi:hypothetical protein